jgi:hypothetical protein
MNANSTPPPTQPQGTRLNPFLLAVVAFALGLGLSVVWFGHHRSSSGPDGLSDSTKSLLGQLAAPVTIRYYSLLPAGSADESLQAFAGRVDNLLNAVQTAGNGKIQVVNIQTPAETNYSAANADGVQAFNLDKGDACCLGLAIVSGKNQEAFARLQPQWEPALEYDLARAILRVAGTSAPAQVPHEVAKLSPETLATINRLIPDVAAVSTAQADQILHDEYFKQCGDVGEEWEAKIQTAQQQVAQARAGGSADELQAAQKNLLQLELAQGDKLKALTAQLQVQLAIVQQMKAAATNSAK